LTLEQLAMHSFPARKPLLVRGETAVFREGHLGELYAERGIGKTWLSKTLALVASSGCEALGFRAPTPCRVLDVDGEMASQEIQDRYALLTERLCIPRTSNLTVVAADWQEEFLPRLDTVEGQAAIEPFVANADFIIIDNRSCLFDPESEKDPSAWQPAQDWLLSLRRRGKGVLVNHHSNRQGGARGHSKPEDPMDILIKLTRPDGYSQEQGASFIVTFDKSRSAHGADVAPFTAQLTIDGWRTSAASDHPDGRRTAIDKLYEYVRLAHAAGERPKSANDAITKAKVRRTDGLKAWAFLKEQGTILAHHDGGFYVR
jgi:hypothetical protein